MTDIPLDTSPITTQFMLEKRRPDGTRPSWKDMPRAWAFDVPAETPVTRESPPVVGERQESEAAQESSTAKVTAAE